MLILLAISKSYRAFSRRPIAQNCYCWCLVCLLLYSTGMMCTPRCTEPNGLIQMNEWMKNTKFDWNNVQSCGKMLWENFSGTLVSCKNNLRPTTQSSYIYKLRIASNTKAMSKNQATVQHKRRTRTNYKRCIITKSAAVRKSNIL